MTDRDDTLLDAEMDALFAHMKTAAPTPSAEFMAAIVADAENEIAQRQAEEVARKAPAQLSLIAKIAAAVGGWGAMAGLATAGVTGLMVGFGAPSMIDSLSYASEAAYVSDGTETYALDDLVTSFYDLGTEG